MFNAQAAFLPLLAQSMSLACFQNPYDQKEGECFLVQNLFDLKCAAHMINSDLKDDDLELSALISSWRLQEAPHLPAPLGTGPTTAMINTLLGQMHGMTSLYEIFTHKLSEMKSNGVFFQIEVMLLVRLIL